MEIFVFLKIMKNYRKNICKVDDTTIGLLVKTTQIINDVSNEAYLVEKELSIAEKCALFEIDEASCHFQRFIPVVSVM